MGRPARFLDISGQRFGRLSVLMPVTSHVTSETKFTCLCDCGKTKDIVGRSLTKGFTVSCGCYRNERVGVSNSTHGASRIGADKKIRKLYSVFSGMWSRCSNRNSWAYHRYGGRGIKVCDRWKDFELFALDMGPTLHGNLSLDRINNDLGYSPDNCRWADNVTQANNKTTNVFLEAFGRRQTGPQWAREFGIKYHTIRARLRLGWGIEDAISRPLVEVGQHRTTKLVVGGETRTLQQWARISGIAAPTIWARIKRGEPVEQAVFREVAPNGQTHKK